MAKSPVQKLKSELPKLSLSDLEKHRSHVDAEIKRKNAARRDEALAAVEKTAKEFGLSLSELTGIGGGKKAKRGAKKSAAPAKYRNPDDPSQTWSGRGRQPAWYKTRIENGEDPASMAI